MKARLASFCLFYGAALATQFLGNYFTMMSVRGWYVALEKSVLTPPGYVFGIVWTALYLLMAVAAWRIHRTQRQGYVSPALQRWWLQLVLGLLWSICFFGLRNPELGFAVILLVWVAIVATIARFLCIERIAGYLLLPLGLWVSFAAYLNGVIALHN